MPSTPDANLINVISLFPYYSSHPDDLSFPANQPISVYEIVDENWYIGEYPTSPTSQTKHHGMFPRSFVRPVLPPRPIAPSYNPQNHITDTQKGEKAHRRKRTRRAKIQPPQQPTNDIEPSDRILRSHSRQQPPNTQKSQSSAPANAPRGPKQQYNPKLQKPNAPPGAPTGPKQQVPKNTQPNTAPPNAPTEPKEQKPPKQSTLITPQHKQARQLPSTIQGRTPSIGHFGKQNSQAQIGGAVPGSHLLHPQSQHSASEYGVGEVKNYGTSTDVYHPPVSIFPVQTARENAKTRDT